MALRTVNLIINLMALRTVTQIIALVFIIRCQSQKKLMNSRRVTINNVSFDSVIKYANDLVYICSLQ